MNGEQEYTRTCDKDFVTFADPTKNECDGPSTIMAECDTFIFGPWEWLYCSKNCGEGVQVGTRTCTALTEVQCPERSELVYQERPCQIQKCPTCENYGYLCDDFANTECIDVVQPNGSIMVS